MMVCPAPPVIDTVLHLLYDRRAFFPAAFASAVADRRYSQVGHYQSSTRLHLSIILRER